MTRSESLYKRVEIEKECVLMRIAYVKSRRVGDGEFWSDLVRLIVLSYLRCHFQHPPFHLGIQIAGGILQVINTGVGHPPSHRRSWLSHLWYWWMRPRGGDSTDGEKTFLCELLHHTRPGINWVDHWYLAWSVTDNDIQWTNIISMTGSLSLNMEKSQLLKKVLLSKWRNNVGKINSM